MASLRIADGVAIVVDTTLGLSTSVERTLQLCLCEGDLACEGAEQGAVGPPQGLSRRHELAELDRHHGRQPGLDVLPLNTFRSG